MPFNCLFYGYSWVPNDGRICYSKGGPFLNKGQFLFCCSNGGRNNDLVTKWWFNYQTTIQICSWHLNAGLGLVPYLDGSITVGAQIPHVFGIQMVERVRFMVPTIENRTMASLCHFIWMVGTIAIAWFRPSENPTIQNLNHLKTELWNVWVFNGFGFRALGVSSPHWPFKYVADMWMLDLDLSPIWIVFFFSFFSYSIFTMRGLPTYIMNVLIVTLLPGSIGLGLHLPGSPELKTSKKLVQSMAYWCILGPFLAISPKLDNCAPIFDFIQKSNWNSESL